MKKEIYIPLSALVIVFGIFSWFFDKQDAKIEKVDTKIEEAENEIVERKIIDEKQSIYIEQMQQNQLKFIEEFKELQKAK